jgi:hypothetical protein
MNDPFAQCAVVASIARHPTVRNISKKWAVIINAGGPPDLEQIKAVMIRHGLVHALPQKLTGEITPQQRLGSNLSLGAEVKITN